MTFIDSVFSSRPRRGINPKDSYSNTPLSYSVATKKWILRGSCLTGVRIRKG